MTKPHLQSSAAAQDLIGSGKMYGDDLKGALVMPGSVQGSQAAINKSRICWPNPDVPFCELERIATVLNVRGAWIR